MLRRVAAGLVGLGLLVSGSAVASTVSQLVNQLVTTQTATQSSTAVAGIISSGISNAISGGGGGGLTAPTSPAGVTSYLNSRDTGRNAGAVDKPFGIWVQGAYTGVDNGQTGAAFDGSIINTVGGFDYRLGERVVIGVAASYETLDIDTRFLDGRGSLENDGFGVTPYIGIRLTDNWSADASFGYTWLSYDAKRTNNSVRGSFDAERKAFNTSLTGVYRAGNFRILPQVGLLYLEEEQDRYRESNGNVVVGNTIKLGRLSAGGRLGYATTNFMPYIKLIGEYDFEHPDSIAIGNGTFTNDQDYGGQIGIGTEFFSTSPVSGSVETSYNSLGRDDLDIWSVTGRIRIRF